MSEIILPEEAKEKEEKPAEDKELTYEATEADEEKFFLMYHLNWSPSEIDAIPEDRRQWIIARFVGQKNMEKEAMAQMRMAQQLGSNPDFRVT
jgi:hypothetical protein